MERDIQLDVYRSLVMIYVLCITHVLYWFSIGTEPIMSIILIEMPIIFFISGASLSMTHPKGLWHTIWSRIKRVVIPYYIYAFVMVCLISLLSFIWHYRSHIESLLSIQISSYYKYNITEYKISNILDILSFQDIPHAHYIWHLWFILPYLILSCTFLQIKLMQKTNRWIYIGCCFTIFIIIQAISENMLLRNLTGYNVFMVAGYLFYKKQERLRYY